MGGGYRHATRDHIWGPYFGVEVVSCSVCRHTLQYNSARHCKLLELLAPSTVSQFQGCRRLRLHLQSPPGSQRNPKFQFTERGVFSSVRSSKRRSTRTDPACTTALFGAGRQREARRGRGEPRREEVERRPKTTLLDFGLSDSDRINAGWGGVEVQEFSRIRRRVRGWSSVSWRPAFPSFSNK